MDTLTHALVGTVIADGWFRRRLGPAAIPFSLVLAALPDIDILVLPLASSGNGWYAHRGYTHSLFAVTIAAPLIGLAAARLSGKPGNRFAWPLLALLCLYSHLLLDAVTSWGTMLFLPFSDARIALDAAPILDIFVFSLSLASCVANRLLRRERIETFPNPLSYPVVHKHPARGRAAAWIARPAAVLIVCYLAIGWLQSRQTAGIARKELAAAGIEAAEIRAMPILFTHLAWSVAARDAAGNVYNALHSSFAPRPMRFVRRPAAAGRAAEAALATPGGKRFAWFVQGMFAVESGDVRPFSGTDAPPEAAKRVDILDCRFFSLAPPWRPRHAFVVFLDAGERVLCSGERRESWTWDGAVDELRRLRDLTVSGNDGESGAEE